MICKKSTASTQAAYLDNLWQGRALPDQPEDKKTDKPPNQIKKKCYSFLSRAVPKNRRRRRRHHKKNEFTGSSFL